MAQSVNEMQHRLAATELPTLGEKLDLVRRFRLIEPLDAPMRSEKAQCVADYFDIVHKIDPEAFLGPKFGENAVHVVTTLHPDALENIMYGARFALQSTMEGKM